MASEACEKCGNPEASYAFSVGMRLCLRCWGENGDRPRTGQDGAPVVPCALPDVLAAFDRWLYLEDKGIVLVVLGTVAANFMGGDPVWFMLVSASSSGKTEALNSILGLPHMHPAATMTVAALLSGTAKRERDAEARGGLLRAIGDFGILVCKDFTSVLSMGRDARAELLGALREIYDGLWVRHVGVDGGRTLSWEGKIGLLAGCTAAIDSHRGVMAQMGERFLLYRLPDVDARKQARKALDVSGRESEMRRELRAAVDGLFVGLHLPEQPPALTEAEAERLVALASLVARSRSAVERDGYSREIELILDPEAPARIVKALRRLYGGLVVIGVERAEAMELVVKTGLDCLPKIRRAVFDLLVGADEWLETAKIATAINYPTQTTRRALEDLTVHTVVQRRGEKGKADAWFLADWARAWYQEARFPEMSEGIYTPLSNLITPPTNISGKRLEGPAEATEPPWEEIDALDAEIDAGAALEEGEAE